MIFSMYIARTTIDEKGIHIESPEKFIGYWLILLSIVCLLEGIKYLNK